MGIIGQNAVGANGVIYGGEIVWPIHVYLQPGHAYYALNRVPLILAGVDLIILATTRLLRDEGRLLLGGRSARKPRKGSL